MPMVVLWSDVGARYTTLILMLILTTCTTVCTSVAASSSFRFKDLLVNTLRGTERGIHRDAFRNSTFLDSIGDPPLIFPVSHSSHQFPHFADFSRPSYRACRFAATALPV